VTEDDSNDEKSGTEVDSLFILSSIHTKKQKQNFTKEAQFEKDKTTVWTKWPTQGRDTFA